MTDLEAYVAQEGRVATTEAVRVSHNIRRISIAPLMAEAVRRINDEHSVSSLFD